MPDAQNYVRTRWKLLTKRNNVTIKVTNIDDRCHDIITVRIGVINFHLIMHTMTKKLITKLLTTD